MKENRKYRRIKSYTEKIDEIEDLPITDREKRELKKTLKRKRNKIHRKSNKEDLKKWTQD